MKLVKGSSRATLRRGGSTVYARKLSTPYLSAGDGFLAATDQPADVGDSGSSYYPERAIARWGGVPFKEYHNDETITVEVVADHVSGISSVQMSLDDGPWVTISNETNSSYLGCPSFQAQIQTSYLSTGQHEVRAIVTPNIGKCRVLQGTLTATSGTIEGTALTGMYSMWLSKLASAPLEVYVDSVSGSDVAGDGTSGNPYATIPHAVYVGLAGSTVFADVSNTVVVLAPGSHAYGEWGSTSASLVTNTGWIKFKSQDANNPAVFDAGATSGNGAYPTWNAMFEDVKFDLRSPLGSSDYLLRGNNGGRLAFLRCTWQSDFQMDSGRFSNGFLSGTFHEYSTGVDLYDSPMIGSFGVGCVIDKMILQSYRFRGLFNCSVSGLNSYARVGEGGNVTNDPDPHPDVYQVYIASGTIENVIIRGLTATESCYTQGLYWSGGTTLFKDISVKDVVMDCTYDGAFTVFKAVQFREATQHHLMKNCTIRGASFLAYDGAYTGADPTGNFASTNMVLDNVHHEAGTGDTNAGDPYLLYPDGPGAGGAWTGYYADAGSPGFPWTSPYTGITYQNM